MKMEKQRFVQKRILATFIVLGVTLFPFSDLFSGDTNLPAQGPSPPGNSVPSPASQSGEATSTRGQSGNSTPTGPTHAPDNLQPTGSSLIYSKDALSFPLILVPAVVEGGGTTIDEANYLGWFQYSLESLGEGSQIGALIALQDLPARDMDIFTFGLGGDIQGLVEGLELSPETYFQFGERTAAVDQRAWAQQLGGKYVLPNNENHIGFGLNFRYVSGDDGAGGSDNRSFLSYENVEPLLTLENQTLGLDVDPNYWAIQGNVGAALSVGSGGNNLILPLNLDYHQLIDGASPAGPSQAPNIQQSGGQSPATPAENPFETFDQLGGVAPPSFSGTPQTPESRSIGGDQAPSTESPSPAASPNHDAAPSATC